MQPFFRIVSAERDAQGVASARLDIYDRIGEETDWWTGEKSGVAAAGFVSSLQALGLKAGDALALHINSPGGDLHAGLTIYHELKRCPATKVAFIDGQAASVASVIACGADKVVMPPAATLWVHNPMTVFHAYLQGYSSDMREAARTALHIAEDLDTYAASLAGIYASRSGGKLSVDEARALMDAETLITAERAIELGLADEIETGLAVSACQDLAPLMDASKAGLKRAIEAAVSRLAPPPKPEPAASELPKAMEAKAIVAACQDAGFSDLAPGLIASDAREDRVLADLALAREIKDKCAAANLEHQAANLIQAFLGKGPGAYAGAVLALKLEEMTPGISSHLPPNPRQGAAAAGVIDLRAVYASRRKRGA